MKKKKNLSRLGGLIATFSLIFLPLASCDGSFFEGPAGWQLITLLGDAPGILSYPPFLLFLLALAAALVSIFYASRVHPFLTGGVGILCIAISFLLTITDNNNAYGDMELKAGTISAFLGFVLIFASGFLPEDST